MIEHTLGEAGTVGGGLDSKIAEHGIGLPSSQKLDHVLVDAGAEERGGAARPQASSRDEGGGDPGIFFERASSMPEGVGE